MDDKVFEPPIDIEIYISREIGVVFSALTSAEVWDKWFTTGMKLEPKRDGVIHFKWANWGPSKYNGEDVGKVLKIEENRTFEFEWHENSDIPNTTVKIILSDMDKGTHLKLTESEYLDTPDGRGWMLSCAAGWGEALALLKMYLEYGVTYTRRFE